MQQTMNIDLTKVKGAFTHTLKGKSGEEMECVIIPIKTSGLFKMNNGGVILDVIAFDRKTQGTNGETHLLKQSLPKPMRDSMTDEEKNSQPILGNMKPFGQQKAQTTAPGAPSVPAVEIAADDNLPF